MRSFNGFVAVMLHDVYEKVKNVAIWSVRQDVAEYFVVWGHFCLIFSVFFSNLMGANQFCGVLLLPKKISILCNYVASRSAFFFLFFVSFVRHNFVLI